jgi:hypothetical protein
MVKMKFGSKPTKGYYSKRDQGANCTKQCNSNEVSKELFLLHLEPGLGKEKNGEL